MATPHPLDGLAKAFSKPPVMCRGAPFWSWNGKLDAATCREQVRLLHEGGMGGFFMHARTGLATRYLSKEWFDCVRACVDEAKRLGMRAWLYDEDRYPSGSAGGEVTRRNERFRSRVLAFHACDGADVPKGFALPGGAVASGPADAAFLKTAGAIAVFSARLGKGHRASGVRRVPCGRDPAPGPGETVVFARVESESPSTWFNNGTYLDTIGRDATGRFIALTHDAYARELGASLGKEVPGIFTDEPHYPPPANPDRCPQDAVLSVASVAWTDDLPAEFKKRAGYDLAPRLLELVCDVDGIDSSRLRHDFNDLLCHLFANRFIRRIGDWCEAHGMASTGHLLCEDSLFSQTWAVGSCMRSYEYMQMPGMDLLTDTWRIFTTAKQVSSAARQFGRKWRLTETYGVTRWDFPLLGHKALGDWQMALGVNLRCHHLAWYTMLADAKRDYPASIFFQSPWWGRYAAVEDYFARVNAILSRGVEVRDILVLHPVESVWMLTRAGWGADSRLQPLERSFALVTENLLASHLDFDYGDEDIMARRARVTVDGRLRVGKAHYRAVVVPRMLTMRSSTLRLLNRFAEAGGTIVFADDPPPRIDCIPSGAAARLASRCTSVRDAASLAAALEPFRNVSVADGTTGREYDPALCLLTRGRGVRHLFVCNTGEHFSRPFDCDGGAYGSSARCRERTAICDDVVIRLSGKAGDVVELDPATGGMKRASAAADGSGCVIRTSLPMLGSRLFAIFDEPSPVSAPLPSATAPRRAKAPRTVSVRPVAASFEPRPSEPNVLVLDRPRYRIGTGRWKGPQEILRVDDEVRAAIGLPVRDNRKVQPYMASAGETTARTSLSLKYSFNVEAIPRSPLHLALEAPGSFRLAINGEPLNAEPDGWWVDPSLQTIPFDPSLLRAGANELSATLDYDAGYSGLEIVYLLGCFGAKVADGLHVSMTAMPGRVKAGDLCGQGFPFYSGNMGYAARVTPSFRRGERVLVRFGGHTGMAARVLVDGVEAGFVPWPPEEVDITGLVVSGRECEIVVELYGSRRNSHGPLHNAEKWPAWTGPAQFRFRPIGRGHSMYSGCNWQDEYSLVPFGLAASPELVVVR